MPLSPRPRPPVIPSALDPDGVREGTGEVIVCDVAQSGYMNGVKREELRYLRVVEAPQKRNWTKQAWDGGAGQQAPAMNWASFENKRILGTAPIQPDGSVRATVPAGRFIFFQVLDGRGRMVHSMRSGTILQPGERLTCMGCHENTDRTMPAPSQRLALARPPERLDGWRGHTREFSYRRDVQPAFNRHCVFCHDFGKKEAEQSRLVLAGDRALLFNQSYHQLYKPGGKPLIQLIGAGDMHVRRARSWGSYPSLLTKVVLGEHLTHPKTTITPDDAERIVTWMDLNGPYYPLYETAFPDNAYGRMPIGSNDWRALTALLDSGSKGKDASLGPAAFSFDRPELSPAITRLDEPANRQRLAAALRDPKRTLALKQLDPNWSSEGDVVGRARAKALEILARAKATLAATPDCDDDRFQPSPPDKERLARVEQFLAIEQAFRLAMRADLRLSERPNGRYRLSALDDPGSLALRAAEKRVKTTADGAALLLHPADGRDLLATLTRLTSP